MEIWEIKENAICIQVTTILLKAILLSATPVHLVLVDAAEYWRRDITVVHTNNKDHNTAKKTKINTFRRIQ